MTYFQNYGKGGWKMIRLITVTLFSLFLFVNFAYADESYNITSCWSGDVTMLSASKELVIFGYDLKGVSRSNDQSTAFDNWSLQIVGTVKIESGKYSSRYYGKYMSPEGDIIIGEGGRDGDKGTWKFIGGTGKWKGITGGGTNKIVPNIKPIKKGTTQGCSIATGTFQLPK
jgi:hypothetical protein